MKAQRRPDQRAFDPGGPVAVADQPVGQPEREIVHRSRRRHADVPVPEAARKVLHRGLRAALDDLDRRRRVGEPVEEAGVHDAGAELGRGDHLAQVGEVGLDAVDARGVERRGQALARLLARRAARDDLGQHRIVERRHLGAARDPGFDSRAVGGEDDVREQTRARLELAPRILGVEPRLHRCAAQVSRQRIERRQLAGGQAHHPLDEIDPGDLLGDAVLDLDARVDLEEVERAGVGVEHELDGAGRPVARGASERRRRAGQRGADAGWQGWARASLRSPSDCAAAASSRARRARARRRRRRRRSAPRRGARAPPASRGRAPRA